MRAARGEPLAPLAVALGVSDARISQLVAEGRAALRAAVALSLPAERPGRGTCIPEEDRR